MSPDRLVRWLYATILPLILVLGGCSSERYETRTLGAVLPFTSSASEIGDSVRKGIELGLEQKNREIVSLGRQYTVWYEDSQASPEIGLQAVERLIQGGVPAIVGPAASGVVLEAAQLANQTRTVLISPTASNPTISRAGPFVFRTTPSDVAEAQSMAAYCRKARLRYVALVTIDNAYGRGFRETFTDRFQLLRGRIVADERFEQGASDFAGLVGRIQNMEPDAIFLVGYHLEMARFLLELRGRGIETPVLSTGGFRFEPLLDRAGQAAEGVVFTQPSYDPAAPEPLIQQFVESFRQTYGREPDIFAAHAYDTIRLLITVTEIADFHGEAIRTSLHAIEDFDGVAGQITFDENGDVKKLPRLWTVHQGRFSPLQ